MPKYQIELACDGTESEEFAAWLRKQGHDATVGNSTGNYVDGATTSADGVASEIMRELWESYCNRDIYGLYINDDCLCDRFLIGTREEWRDIQIGEHTWREWYEQYETDPDRSGEPMEFDDWVEQQLDTHLSEATPEDIERHPRVTD